MFSYKICSCFGSYHKYVFLRVRENIQLIPQILFLIRVFYSTSPCSRPGSLLSSISCDCSWVQIVSVVPSSLHTLLSIRWEWGISYFLILSASYHSPNKTCSIQSKWEEKKVLQFRYTTVCLYFLVFLQKSCSPHHHFPLFKLTRGSGRVALKPGV